MTDIVPRTLKTSGKVIVIAGTLLSGTMLAHADAIDGNWCSEQGRRIAISGSSVTTPNGMRMQGQYTRHSFTFTMPPAEVDAGQPVDMQLQSETRVRVTIGTSNAQIWRRCSAETS